MCTKSLGQKRIYIEWTILKLENIWQHTNASIHNPLRQYTRGTFPCSWRHKLISRHREVVKTSKYLLLQVARKTFFCYITVQVYFEWDNCWKLIRSPDIDYKGEILVQIERKLPKLSWKNRVPNESFPSIAVSATQHQHWKVRDCKCEDIHSYVSSLSVRDRWFYTILYASKYIQVSDGIIL
jgi:hypothetical protein